MIKAEIEITEEFVSAVRKVVDYLWYDEQRHFEDCELDEPADCTDHIFLSVQCLGDWLDEHFPDIENEGEAILTDG